jgi:hypothetical protein
MNPRTKPRGASKLERLPKHQLNQLYRWLAVEKIIYSEAIKRLENQFGVKANGSNLTKFWNRVCVPRLQRANKIAPDRGVLLDVVLRRRKNNSFQIQILQRNKSIALFGSKNIRLISKGGAR